MARDEPGDGAGGRAGADSRPGGTARGSGPAGTAQVSTFPDPPTEPAGLTPRQRKVLEVIRDWVERFGYPPSVREIGDAVGLTSTSSVHHQLRTLERKGYLRRDPNRTRAVDVRGPEDAAARRRTWRRVPRRRPAPATCAPHPPSSRCSATSPPAARSWPSRPWRASSRCPARSSARAPCSCSTSRGDSMVDAAITDGDWVVVRQQPVAENGEIVAAMIDGEATVKTFKRRDGHVWLMPANPAYEPIPGDDATVLGRVVAVLRRL